MQKKMIIHVHVSSTYKLTVKFTILGYFKLFSISISETAEQNIQFWFRFKLKI